MKTTKAKKKKTPKPARERPSDERILEEIAELRKLQPAIPRRTAFGDDNQAAIDAQLTVMERRMDNDDVFDEYGEDSDEFKQHTLDAALDAMRWLDGEGGESPADAWRPLARGRS